MAELVQIKAEIPRELKRRAFAAFALREQKFNRWLRMQMEDWLKQVEGDNEAVAVVADDHQGVRRSQSAEAAGLP